MGGASPIKIACLGGGSGLSTLLYGLKGIGDFLDISAIVTMFDSGGNSGFLRDRFGILPPGDIARCIVALSRSEHSDFLREFFAERFEGMSLANAMIFGLQKQCPEMNYQEIIDFLCNRFSIAGRVFPVSVELSNLHARFEGGSECNSETKIDARVRAGMRVIRVSLNPSVPGHEPAVAAIKNADVICIGPGSLYTSLIPTLLPREISIAIQASKAPIILVMNLMQEGLGMAKLDAVSITEEIESYLGRTIDCILVNRSVPHNYPVTEYEGEGKRPILYSPEYEPRFRPVDVWLEDKVTTFHSSNLHHNGHTVHCDEEFIRQRELARHDPPRTAMEVFRTACDLLDI